jgi:hypothetical protein
MLSTLNTTVNTGKTYQKMLCVLWQVVGSEEETKSAFQEVGNWLVFWFKQAQHSYVVVSDTLLTENTLHIGTRSGIEDLEASNGRIDSFK